jgi:hypothetical protein
VRRTRAVENRTRSPLIVSGRSTTIVGSRYTPRASTMWSPAQAPRIASAIDAVRRHVDRPLCGDRRRRDAERQ